MSFFVRAVLFGAIDPDGEGVEIEVNAMFVYMRCVRCLCCSSIDNRKIHGWNLLFSTTHAAALFGRKQFTFDHAL